MSRLQCHIPTTLYDAIQGHKKFFPQNYYTEPHIDYTKESMKGKPLELHKTPFQNH